MLRASRYVGEWAGNERQVTKAEEERNEMRRVLKFALIVVGLALVVTIIAAGVLAIVEVRRPYPQTAGEVTLPGLQDEVHIYRDKWGVPHIYAQSAEDLFFAQGYVHAQDRFWQMEMWRHTGQGRLSEITGEATVELDTLIRTLGWNRMAADSLAYYENEAPETMAILEAYSAGVNAYLTDNRDNLSLNKTILELVGEPWEIEPWEPLDTVSWSVVMAYQLSGNWTEELSRARLYADVGEGVVDTLVPGYPYESRPVIAPTSDQINDLPEATHVPAGSPTAINWSNVNTTLVGELPAGLAFGDGPFLGSNNWVVSGEHTATGLPMLANDPHLGIQMPAIWYEAGLHAPGWDITGFTFAGVPGVVIGHNDRIAWGVTNVGPDVQDLYIEKINPNNPRQYEFEGEWVDMEVIEEVISVNGGDDVTLEVLVTRHGPLVTNVTATVSDLAEGLKDQLALRWTAAEPSRLLQAVLMLNQAQDFDAFHEALRYWDVPAQNVVYADIDGNIGYQMPGLVPVRAAGDGLEPVPGWTGEYEWDDWIPYEELPALYNPDSGFIVTANNAVVDEDYPNFIARDWADGDRAFRITEMLQEAIERGDVTLEDLALIQFDSKSMLAATYIPLFAGLSSSDPQVQAAIERLRGWDLQERRDSVPAALFEIFYMQLAENVLADDVGEEHYAILSKDAFFYDLAEQPDASWWDDQSTSGSESREEILLASIADAVAYLNENVGSNMDDWTWGALHTATFVSDPLGQVDITAWLVNRGPFPTDGGTDLVNASSWRWSDPAVVRGHPSMRMLVDMSNFDASRTIIPTGQSGHPFHEHYDDMIELWLNGEYHPMLFDRTTVEAAAADHLLLQPTSN